jgi:hypothetical protein
MLDSSAHSRFVQCTHLVICQQQQQLALSEAHTEQPLPGQAVHCTVYSVSGRPVLNVYHSTTHTCRGRTPCRVSSLRPSASVGKTITIFKCSMFLTLKWTLEACDENLPSNLLGRSIEDCGLDPVISSLCILFQIFHIRKKQAAESSGTFPEHFFFIGLLLYLPGRHGRGHPSNYHRISAPHQQVFSRRLITEPLFCSSYYFFYCNIYIWSTWGFSSL